MGIYIPLIVVNCIILGRAEAFAAKNGPIASMFDGLGMGLGFTMALTILGGVREFLGTGKRKTSVARVRLSVGTGNITVNGKDVNEYMPFAVLVMDLKQPLVATSTETRFDIMCNVNGGGYNGQTGAIRLGIARALLLVNPDFRGPLKKAGLLTRDSRSVERKKPGQPKARRRFQFSKR